MLPTAAVGNVATMQHGCTSAALLVFVYEKKTHARQEKADGPGGATRTNTTTTSTHVELTLALESTTLTTGATVVCPQSVWPELAKHIESR